MKYLIPVLFFLMPLISEAQDNLPLNAEGKIEFTEVISVDSAGAKTLYSRARLFIANAFNSAPDVTKLEDENTKTIVTKGFLPRNYTYPFNRDFGGNVAFTFTIQCRDGRFKYSVTEFFHQDRIKPSYSGGQLENVKPACGGLNMTKAMWAKIKKETAGHVEAYIKNLKETMSGEKAFSAQDNW